MSAHLDSLEYCTRTTQSSTAVPSSISYPCLSSAVLAESSRSETVSSQVDHRRNASPSAREATGPGLVRLRTPEENLNRLASIRFPASRCVSDLWRIPVTVAASCLASALEHRAKVCGLLDIGDASSLGITFGNRFAHGHNVTPWFAEKPLVCDRLTLPRASAGARKLATR